MPSHTPSTTPANEYLTPADAARRLGLMPARVRQLVDAGELRAIRSVTGWRLIELVSVERLLAQRQAPHPPQEAAP